MMYICYHTGAGDLTAETLEQAMEIADEGACYTQTDITIEDEDGNILAERRWYGCKADLDDLEDGEDIIDFGDFGYYGPWVIY